ncbi:MAG: hypothetical protein ACYTFO_01730 [Planctomycetota bacterium]
MTVPAYTNIAHFRAPYKNSYVYTGVGQDVPVAPPGPPASPEQAVKQFIETDKEGRHRFNAKTASSLRKALESYNAIWLNDQSRLLEPFSPEQLQAAKDNAGYASQLKSISGATFVEKQLAAGRVVFASIGLVVPGAGAKQLMSIPKEDPETVNTASRIYPILAEPSALANLATPTNLIIGAVVVGGIGVLIYATTRKKSRRSSAPLTVASLT